MKSRHLVIICLRVITSNSISVLNSQYLHVSKTTIEQYIFSLKSSVFLGNCRYMYRYVYVYDRCNILN